MLAKGISTFYQYAGEIKVAVYNPGKGAYEPIPRPAGLIVLKEKKDAGKLRIFGIPFDDDFIDIGIPETYRQASLFFRNEEIAK